MSFVVKLAKIVFFFLKSKSDAQVFKCSEKYLNKNQMSVISTIVTTSVNLWESAHCYDCYSNTTSIDQIFSEHAIRVFKLHSDYINCTKSSKSDICERCKDSYMNMNMLFDHEKEKNEGKICFDLQDLVNQ